MLIVEERRDCWEIRCGAYIFLDEDSLLLKIIQPLSLLPGIILPNIQQDCQLFQLFHRDEFLDLRKVDDLVYVRVWGGLDQLQTVFLVFLVEKVLDVLDADSAEEISCLEVDIRPFDRHFLRLQSQILTGRLIIIQEVEQRLREVPVRSIVLVDLLDELLELEVEQEFLEREAGHVVLEALLGDFLVFFLDV